jgi:hypothetical protein
LLERPFGGSQSQPKVHGGHTMSGGIELIHALAVLSLIAEITRLMQF